SAADRGNHTKANASIFVLGFSDDEGTHGRLPNDPLTVATLMRWGNYDVATDSTQWNVSEVPSDLSHFANAVPAMQDLPASFYLFAKPAWWASAPWPPIGPDVTDGPGAGGHAYDIPAALCYANNPVDGDYGVSNVRIFNASNCYTGLDSASNSILH